MKELKWPAVAVILGLMVVLGFLADRGKDATIVLAGIIAVLGALGFGALHNKQSEIQASAAKIEASNSEIKENTNGRIGQLTDLLEKTLRSQQDSNDQHRRDMKDMIDKMAVMSPIPTDPPVSGGGSHASDLHVAPESRRQGP